MNKVSTAAEAELKSLVNRRQYEFASLQAIYDLSKEAQENSSKISSFRARFKKIETIRNNFIEINDQINEKRLMSEPGFKLDNQLLTSFDDLYFAAIEFADSLESQTDNKDLNGKGMVEARSQINLPKLQTPKFDGNIENWQTFKDSYLPLIHNNASLSDIEKFHYLISCLSGFALTLAKGVPITAANYCIVYNALIDRYDNKRILATTYLDKVFKLVPLNRPSLEGLNELSNTLYECINALRALNIESLGEFVLFYIASRAVDNETRNRFELQNKNEIPTFDDLITYLQNYIRILEVSQTTTTSAPRTQNKQNYSSKTNNNKKYSPQQNTSLVAAAQLEKRFVCPCCNLNHSIYKCVKLKSMDVSSRRQLVNELKLCSNCLRSGHESKACNSKSTCFTCGSKHNSLLHVDAVVPTPNNVQNEAPSATLTCATKAVSDIVGRNLTKILGSAIVRVRHANGSLQYARALIDSCSMESFITTSCARRLELPVRRCHMSVDGLGQSSVQSIKGVTFCSIMPRSSDTPKFDLPVVVLPKITSMMPSRTLPATVREHFQHLNLADNNFDKAGPIDLLIGVEYFDQIYNGARYAPGPGLPCALSSVFGWVISGLVDNDANTHAPHASSEPVTSLIASTCALDKIVQRFWETEEPPQATISIPENDVCEQIYKSGTYRTSDGRYIVPIMLKDDAPPLNDSHRTSCNRFYNLEKRFTREPDLKVEYAEFIHQYEELGHMQLAAASSTDHSYVIPHHCIVKPGSSTTRLRVVFDASSKTSNGNSLNDIVHTGPKLQIDIIDLITKFRLHKIVFTADICKMYRQILIRPEERSYQHILWRDRPDMSLKEYELNTVTYGVSSSPYLAIRTLRQLAEDHGSEYRSRAAQVLREDTFMDDVTTGCSSLEEARLLKKDLVSLLRKGKFELRKWSSNDPSLLDDIPSEHCQTTKLFDEAHQEFVKILGIKWDPASDHFSYEFSEHFNIEFTKRSILSIIARIFDPLGWICPIILGAKVLLQEMWRLNLSWDEAIPNHLAKQWHILAANLNDLQRIKLPRLILPPDPTQIHLVGFCDGSSKGYGCCVYLCITTPQVTRVSLLIGKSKVAPVKPTTVNRLELCAAVLLARVLRHMANLLNDKIKIDFVRAYSDSSTILSWLNTQPHLLKMYVANRVVQCTDLINSNLWSHVSTHENPADCCSRGTSCVELAEHKLWWTGPPWLVQPSVEWPSPRNLVPEQDLPELKPPVSQSLVIADTNDLVVSLIERHSSFPKLIRTFGWWRRYLHNLRSQRDERTFAPLSKIELENSLVVLVKSTQQSQFQNELEHIDRKESCTKAIQKLSPFIDHRGLIRVGGRIENANLPECTLHPLLLPKSCSLSKLIVEYYHKAYFHCGPRTLQSLIQRKFWILGIRNLIRSIVSKCIICFKAKPVPCQPSMGNLPATRVQIGRCFQTTGIDFAGPFTLKESKRRNARTYKAYLCLFVCLRTKAVHLELVTELSTEAFLAALDRFVSRRGICSEILTDCGTNFVGANRQLKEMYDFLRTHYTELSDCLTNRQVNWRFNPPSAPHFGAIFESGIKSTKYHLKRVVGSQVLTLEEMSTVLTKVEAILNSRPLCALSSDPSEADVLTPGHFLVGGPLVALPETPLDDTRCPRSRWQMLQRLTQSFWRLWQRDYLHTLQQKNKWFVAQPNVRVGDLVLVVDSNLPTMLWRLAKIVQLHPGPDNVVRVVTLKTANGHTFRRPVVKLCPLPM